MYAQNFLFIFLPFLPQRDDMPYWIWTATSPSKALHYLSILPNSLLFIERTQLSGFFPPLSCAAIKLTRLHLHSLAANIPAFILQYGHEYVVPKPRRNVDRNIIVRLAPIVDYKIKKDLFYFCSMWVGHEAECFSKLQSPASYILWHQYTICIDEEHQHTICVAEDCFPTQRNAATVTITNKDPRQYIAFKLATKYWCHNYNISTKEVWAWVYPSLVWAL